MKTRLKLQGLEKRWQSDDRVFELVVDDIEISAGDAWALTGPNGCGKSTFLELAGLATRPDAAASFRLETNGQSVDLLGLWQAGRLDSLASLRGAHFGYILQTGALLPFLNVRDNVAQALRQARKKDTARLEEMLERLELSALLRAYPAQLSIGQRQRVAVARALAHDPAFVLADEPTAALDPESAEQVLLLLLELVRDQGAAMVVVSHDQALLQRLRLQSLPLTTASRTVDTRACWHTTIGSTRP